MLNIIDKERPEGVVVQFGGQTGDQLGRAAARGWASRSWARRVEAIDLAEDRDKFERFLRRLGIPQTEGRAVTSVEEAMGVALKIGFPVVVRPSYVLGGRAMEIVHNESELFEYMKFAVAVSPKHPVLVDRYIAGKEVEVDAISRRRDRPHPRHHGARRACRRPLRRLDGGLPAADGERSERSGRSSTTTIAIARGLGVVGLVNIQYVIHEGKVYVLEVNPRASRTVPYSLQGDRHPDGGARH